MGLREILKKAAPLSPAAQFRIKRTKLEEALLKHIKAFENDTGLTVSKVSPYANPGESKTARVEIVVLL